MSFVTAAGLLQSLKQLKAYRDNGNRFLSGLPTIFVLKRLGLKDGTQQELSIEQFTSVCDESLRIVAAGDPTVGWGETYYNVLSPGLNPLVADGWPRSTLWTRYANQSWQGILAAQKRGNKLVWRLEKGWRGELAKRIPGVIPGYFLATFVLRRPSDLAEEVKFNTKKELLREFCRLFHLNRDDEQVFDLRVPPAAEELGGTELSRREVIQTVADSEPNAPLRARLAAEAKQTGVDLADQIVACGREMGQVLVFGPPGTGKTHWAKEAAARLAGFPKGFETATQAGRAKLVVWHPSTTYEDFVRGVDVRGGDVTPRNGIFLDFCEKASTSSELHVLVIDEINRGNTVAILGELLFGLEMNKRGTTFYLADGTPVVVPKNLVLIATANTADRSIAALDVALGRRFARVEVPPEPRVLGDVKVGNIGLAQLLDALNSSIMDSVDRDHRLGHAYLLDVDGNPLTSVEDLVFAFRYRIVPLLQDYALDDFALLERVLGDHIVDVERQMIRTEVFENKTAFEAALATIPGIKPL